MIESASPEWRAATEADGCDIRELLGLSALPTADIESSRPEFIVAREGSQLVAVGGLQRFGKVGLLRSVAVRVGWRGTGLGQAVVKRLEQHARMAGVTELVLLTETAREFFESQGYEAIDRRAAPSAVQGSEEFKALCPQSAACMLKRLESFPR